MIITKIIYLECLSLCKLGRNNLFRMLWFYRHHQGPEVDPKIQNYKPTTAPRYYFSNNLFQRTLAFLLVTKSQLVTTIAISDWLYIVFLTSFCNSNMFFIDFAEFTSSVTFDCDRCLSKFATPSGLHLHRNKHHQTNGKFLFKFVFFQIFLRP